MFSYCLCCWILEETIELPMEFEFPHGGAFTYPVVLKISSDGDDISYLLKDLVSNFHKF